MARLTDALKLYIVHRLACFDSPSEVVEAVKETFAVAVSRQQVQFYDPTVSSELGERWRSLFDEARAAFLADVSRIPIAQKAWRLDRLQRLYRKAEQAGQVATAAALIEQASRESPDERLLRRWEGDDLAADPRNMSEDERLARVSKIMDLAHERAGRHGTR